MRLCSSTTTSTTTASPTTVDDDDERDGDAGASPLPRPADRARVQRGPHAGRRVAQLDRGAHLHPRPRRRLGPRPHPRRARQARHRHRLGRPLQPHRHLRTGPQRLRLVLLARRPHLEAHPRPPPPQPRRHLCPLVAQRGQVCRRLRRQAHRHLQLRDGAGLVGRQAHQEAHPLHRPRPRLAPQQCPPRSRLGRHARTRLQRLHQGRRCQATALRLGRASPLWHPVRRLAHARRRLGPRRRLLALRRRPRLRRPRLVTDHRLPLGPQRAPARHPQHPLPHPPLRLPRLHLRDDPRRSGTRLPARPLRGRRPDRMASRALPRLGLLRLRLRSGCGGGGREGRAPAPAPARRLQAHRRPVQRLGSGGHRRERKRRRGPTQERGVQPVPHRRRARRRCRLVLVLIRGRRRVVPPPQRSRRGRRPALPLRPSHLDLDLNLNLDLDREQPGRADGLQHRGGWRAAHDASEYDHVCAVGSWRSGGRGGGGEHERCRWSALCVECRRGWWCWWCGVRQARLPRRPVDGRAEHPDRLNDVRHPAPGSYIARLVTEASVTICLDRPSLPYLRVTRRRE